MANEHVGRRDEIGLGKEVTAGTAVSVTDWLPRAEGSEFNPEIIQDFFPGTFGTIDAVNKGAVTGLGTDITINCSPTDKFFGHFLMALFGTTYPCVRIPVTSVSADFTEGETITESVSNATGTLIRNDSQNTNTKYLYIAPATGTFTGGQTLTGGTSSSTATGGTIESPSSVRDHVFRRANTNTHPSYTIYNNSPLETVRAAFCMIESMEIEVVPDKYVMVTTKWKGKFFSSTSATPSYTTENFFFGKNAAVLMQATFGALVGSTAISVGRLKLVFTKKLEQFRAVGSTDFASQHNTEFDVRGDMDLLYNATTQRGYVTGGTEQALQLKIANSAVTIGSAGNPTIQFDLPLCFFTEFRKPTPMGGIVKQTLGFVGQKDPTRGFPVEAVLRNTRVTTY